MCDSWIVASPYWVIVFDVTWFNILKRVRRLLGNHNKLKMASLKKWSETIVIFHPIYSVSDMYNFFYVYKIYSEASKILRADWQQLKILVPRPWTQLTSIQGYVSLMCPCVNPRLRILRILVSCVSKLNIKCTSSSYNLLIRKMYFV